MRTAEEFVADMRRMGRSDDQVRTVAHVTHGGKLAERVDELLEMTEAAAAKLAPEKVELCEKCGSPFDADGSCPYESEHIDDVLDDKEEEYCEVCESQLVNGKCVQCTSAAANTIEDQVAMDAVSDMIAEEEASTEINMEAGAPPIDMAAAKKKRRRAL